MREGTLRERSKGDNSGRGEGVPCSQGVNDEIDVAGNVAPPRRKRRRST